MSELKMNQRAVYVFNYTNCNLGTYTNISDEIRINNATAEYMALIGLIKLLTEKFYRKNSDEIAKRFKIIVEEKSERNFDVTLILKQFNFEFDKTIKLT